MTTSPIRITSLAFEGIADLLESYRSRTIGTDLDALAYAQMQVVSKAIEDTGSVDDTVLSEFTRHDGFSTVIDGVAFETRGEWTHSRLLQVLSQGIIHHDLDHFRDGSREVVVAPTNGGVEIPDLNRHKRPAADAVHRPDEE